MCGTIPCVAAARASVRVDQCVICNPIPAGSQQASCSIWTRCRGGKAPRGAQSGSIKDGFDPYLLVATTQVPHRLSSLSESLSKLLHHGALIDHGKQTPSPPRDSLLCPPVTHKGLQVGSIFVWQADPLRWVSHHPTHMEPSLDYVKLLVIQSTRKWSSIALEAILAVGEPSGLGLVPRLTCFPKRG